MDKHCLFTINQTEKFISLPISTLKILSSETSTGVTIIEGQKTLYDDNKSHLFGQKYCLQKIGVT